MRVLTRVALVAIVLLSSVPAFADHLEANCPLSLVASNPPADEIELSPHGVFRSGSLVYVLRGQFLTTYNVTDLGDMQIVREDFIGELAARESKGAVAFKDGYLYISSEAGLEVFDLRNVRAGGTTPRFVTAVPGLHYRRLVANGNVLAGTFPATDLPCFPRGTSFCRNTIDIISIANREAPVRVAIIPVPDTTIRGFNDVAFNQGFLYTATEGGTIAFNVASPGVPVRIGISGGVAGKFLVSNGTNLLGVGNDETIDLYTVGLNAGLTHISTFTIARETIDRANPIRFHRQAFIDEQAGRLITMLDELDLHTLQPARTFAFDIFDLTAPMWEGAFQRGYENVSYTTPDEVKHNPFAVGPLIYTVGELSGLQTWGSCGTAAGAFEWDNLASIFCGTTEIKGWVTGTQKVANVEIFLDASSLGPAEIGGPNRTDIPSRTPVNTFRLSASFDAVTRGEHVLRAVATDVLGNRRQFASQRVFFPGPGVNCRRRAVRR